MDEQDRQENDGGSRSSRADSVEADPGASRDGSESDAHTPDQDDGADENPVYGEGAEGTLQEWTSALNALERASELFVGLPDDVDDSVRTYVSELPQWFRDSQAIEAKIRVGDDVFETDSFRPTLDTLNAKAHTRIGTAVSMTVVSTDRRPGTGQRAWLASERELAETTISLITSAIERWEIDSLKRVSDGVAVLDDDLAYRYVNQQAEQLLGRDNEELRGESVWEVFPEAADTIAEEKIRTALDTGSSTSFDRYNTQKEQWVEASVHPSDDGVIIVFTEITDSKVAERKLDRVLETVPIGIVLLTPEGEITRANPRAEALLGLSESRMDGVAYDHPDWDIWDEAGNPIPRENHPVMHVRRTGETIQGCTHGITLPDGSERWLSSNVAPVKGEDGSIEQIIVALEDVTVHKRLEQLTETFQPVSELLNSATADEEIERPICELLTDTREYQYARIYEYTPETELTESDLEEGSGAVAANESVTRPIQSRTEVAPAAVAVETAEIQAVRRNQSDSQFERWRAYTLEQGFQGGAIVPLAHRSRVYGLLVLYTDRGEAFGSREQTLLTTLGERIGQVLHSLATERILHADNVAELTFESTDSASFFVSASEQLGCTIEIRDTIPASDEMLVHYVSVQDASLDALEDIAENGDWAAQVRQIRHTEDPPGGEVEIGLCRQSLAQTLVTEGAVVTADTVTDGRAEVICEVPLGNDIGSLVTRVQESFPDTTLVSKREYTPAVESNTHTVGRMLGEIFETELTDRQQQVLRAALYGGYFQSPRRSTATEIANALSLTQSTFSYHLRNAQQTLFEQLFDRIQQ
ncbi:PAS domain S-box protein [Haloplanus rallus]|uniref:PAS domain S-box protein n=1 Tax=Haloplanus rallus TaxID=1816183 RepID=A0A6B9FD36_9EURY|nr:PAS domain-containing protein [Haloplanus rallus]QGX93789.1 PAS domain S-box protein [Haloplanus rallus]